MHTILRWYAPFAPSEKIYLIFQACRHRSSFQIQCVFSCHFFIAFIKLTSILAIIPLMREYRYFSPYPRKAALYFKSRATDGSTWYFVAVSRWLHIISYHHMDPMQFRSERTQKCISQQRLLKSVHHEKTQKPSHIWHCQSLSHTIRSYIRLLWYAYVLIGLISFKRKPLGFDEWCLRDPS